MSQYLLDTDWIIDVLHGQEQATQTLLELAAFGFSVAERSFSFLDCVQMCVKPMAQTLLGRSR